MACMREALARAEAAEMVNDWSEAAEAAWVSSASASHDAEAAAKRQWTEVTCVGDRPQECISRWVEHLQKCQWDEGKRVLLRRR